MESGWIEPPPAPGFAIDRPFFTFARARTDIALVRPSRFLSIVDLRDSSRQPVDVACVGRSWRHVASSAGSDGQRT